MEFFDVLKKRFSVRSFKNREVEEEKINKILEAANSAPSAGNLQGYEIILIKDSNKKSLIAKAAYGQHFIEEAPIVLIICANEKRSASRYGKRGKELYCINDASIAAAYIELAACNLGLGSVWVGAFDENEIKKIIDAPEYIRPIAIIPIGYPNEIPGRRERRKLDDLVHINKF
ncbi:MAG: nitroreductase family protein [Candidatus Aenigmatarchaeota archaeon]